MVAVVQDEGEGIIVVKPAQSDILCGKDKTYSLHPGNQVFRSRIEEAIQPYMSAAKKYDKMQFTREIVQSMQNDHGARFLRPIVSNGEAAWQEISDASARDKVSHALRFASGRKVSTGKANVNKIDGKNSIRNEKIQNEKAIKKTTGAQRVSAGKPKESEDETAPACHRRSSSTGVEDSTLPSAIEAKRPDSTVSGAAIAQVLPQSSITTNSIIAAQERNVQSLLWSRQVMLNNFRQPTQPIAMDRMVQLNGVRAHPHYPHFVATSPISFPPYATTPPYATAGRMYENVLCPTEASIMVGGRPIPCLVLLPEQALKF